MPDHGLDRYGNVIRECPVPYGLGFATARYSVTEREPNATNTVHLHRITLASGQSVLASTSIPTLERTRIECLKHYALRAMKGAA